MPTEVKMNQNLEAQTINDYQQGNKQTKQLASNKLWLAHSKWIGNIVGKRLQKKSGLIEDELISEACAAFFEAVKNYDISSAENCSLKTYAVYWINGALNRYARAQMYNNFVVPRCSAKLRDRIIERVKSNSSLSHYDIDAIAKEFSTSKKHIKDLETFFCHGGFVSLNNRGDFISSDINFTEAQIDRDKLLPVIQKFVQDQPEKIKKTLTKRWLTDKKTSYHQLAKELGGSYENKRQIEKQAFRKLIDHLKQAALLC